jgi:hypothetical protein
MGLVNSVSYKKYIKVSIDDCFDNTIHNNIEDIGDNSDIIYDIEKIKDSIIKDSIIKDIQKEEYDKVSVLNIKKIIETMNKN